MKISQLPQEVKEKALEYQRNASNLFNKNTDDLEFAFDWGLTKEGCDYWHEWFNSSSPKKIIYSEENMSEYAYYFESCIAKRPMEKPLIPKKWFNEFKK
jgi:hypothetical protein